MKRSARFLSSIENDDNEITKPAMDKLYIGDFMAGSITILLYNASMTAREPNNLWMVEKITLTIIPIKKLQVIRLTMPAFFEWLQTIYPRNYRKLRYAFL